jgi:hypothetical protein
VIAGFLGVVLGTYRAMKDSWREARLQAKLREEAKGFAAAGVTRDAEIPGVGKVIQAVNLAREVSHYVGGIFSGWRQRSAHEHPEQGKVSRAFEAHGKSVIVLNDETEKESQVVERTQLQRRHRFQRAAARTTFWSAFAGIVLGGINLLSAVWPAAATVIGSLPFLAAIPGWAPVVLLGAAVLGLAIAWMPALHEPLTRVVYLPVDLVRARWVNTLFTLAAPIALVWGAWALLSAFVVPFAAAFWMPLAAVFTVAGLWGLVVLVAGLRTEGSFKAYGTIGTLWRIAAALGVVALAATPIAMMVVYSQPWGWVALSAAVLFGLARTITRIFIQSDQPLQSMAEWLWSQRYLVRYGLIAAGLVYAVGWVGPLLYAGWGAVMAAALPALPLSAAALAAV